MCRVRFRSESRFSGTQIRTTRRRLPAPAESEGPEGRACMQDWNTEIGENIPMERRRYDPNVSMIVSFFELCPHSKNALPCEGQRWHPMLNISVSRLPRGFAALHYEKAAAGWAALISIRMFRLRTRLRNCLSRRKTGSAAIGASTPSSSSTCGSLVVFRQDVSDATTNRS